METDPEKYKQQVTSVFDTVASGYDNSSMRFFSIAADKMIGTFNPSPGEKILDLATGTGAVAIACAPSVLPDGRVMAIDLSSAMLERAVLKSRDLGLTNIDFLKMDAAIPEFGSGSFSHVVCGFALFFMPDMSGALQQWARIIKPGGRIVFTSFSQQAFMPMIEMFIELLEEYGVEFEASPVSSQRLSNPDQCLEVMTEANLQDCQVDVYRLGYPLQCGDDWWKIVSYSGLRGLFDRLDESKKEMFRVQHLKALQPLFTDKGLWMNVDVLVSHGTVGSKA